jgi:hypothetical protein
MLSQPPEALDVVHRTPFYVFGKLRGQPSALLRRTDQRFASLLTLMHENDLVIEAFRRLSASGIVVDMRAAPPNNSPEFEGAMQKLRLAVGRAYAHVVVVVASASGEMQVGRLHRSENTPYRVTRSLELAWQLAAGDNA